MSHGHCLKRLGAFVARPTLLFALFSAIPGHASLAKEIAPQILLSPAATSAALPSWVDAARRSRLMAIDPEALRSGDRVQIDPFPDVRVVLRLKERKVAMNALQIWTGEVEGEPGRMAIFVSSHDRVQGWLESSAGVYGIQTLPSGEAVVWEPIPQDPDCAANDQPTRADGLLGGGGGDPDLPVSHPTECSQICQGTFGPDGNNNPAIVTVLMLYTETLAAELATAGIDFVLEAQQQVEQANLFIRNSYPAGAGQLPLPLQLHLVGVHKVPFQDSNDICANLFGLIELPQALRLRNHYCADLVQLWVKHADNPCVASAEGCAAVLGTNHSDCLPGIDDDRDVAFSVICENFVRLQQSAGAHLMVHELGHNLALKHGRNAPDTCLPSSMMGADYAHGIINTRSQCRMPCSGPECGNSCTGSERPSFDGYITIMANRNGMLNPSGELMFLDRVRVFENPELPNYDGRALCPLGIGQTGPNCSTGNCAQDLNGLCQADNACLLSRTSKYVANYRENFWGSWPATSPFQQFDVALQDCAGLPPLNTRPYASVAVAINGSLDQSFVYGRQCVDSSGRVIGDVQAKILPSPDRVPQLPASILNLDSNSESGIAEADVAASPAGNFYFASTGVLGQSKVHLRSFAANGAPVWGSPSPIAVEAGAGIYRSVRVAARRDNSSPSSDNGAIVVWSLTPFGLGLKDQVRLRIYDRNQLASFPIVLGDASVDNRNPAVAIRVPGLDPHPDPTPPAPPPIEGFIVAFERVTASESRIRVHLLSPAGTTIQTLYADMSPGWHTDPEVVMMDDETALLTWRRQDPSSGVKQIVWRRLFLGTWLEDEQVASGASEPIGAPSAAMLPDGFLLTWPTTAGVQSRRYDLFGLPLTSSPVGVETPSPFSDDLVDVAYAVAAPTPTEPTVFRGQGTLVWTDQLPLAPPPGDIRVKARNFSHCKTAF